LGLVLPRSHPRFFCTPGRSRRCRRVRPRGTAPPHAGRTLALGPGRQPGVRRRRRAPERAVAVHRLGPRSVARRVRHPRRPPHPRGPRRRLRRGARDQPPARLPPAASHRRSSVSWSSSCVVTTWCGRASHARSCSSSRRRRRSRSISLVDGSEVTTRPSHCTRASRDPATRPPRAGSRDILGRRDVAGQGCDMILHRPRNHHDWSPRPLPVRTALMGTPLTQWTLKDCWTAWGGAALIVIPSFVFTLLSLAGGSDEAGTVGRLALALVFGGLVALLTVAAYRRGAQGFALGVAGEAEGSARS